jgi:putative ABC transport system ATP-binding protein
MADVDSTLTGALPPASGVLLAVEGLAFSHGGAAGPRQILDDITFHLVRGEVLGLLGRSGSGKSTLLNLISGIERPDCGSVRLAGAAMTEGSERHRTLLRRRKIGFVYQSFNLVPTLTALEDVALVAELNGASLPEALARGQQMLVRTGLAERGGQYPEQLSGGEQQRVAIARALVHSPSLVLADEPTGNLDVHSGRGMLDLMLALAQDQGAGVILVTHSREVAARAGRCLTLEDGRLVAGGDVTW